MFFMWFSYGFLMVFLWLPYFFYDFLMAFLFPNQTCSEGVLADISRIRQVWFRKGLHGAVLGARGSVLTNDLPLWCFQESNFR